MISLPPLPRKVPLLDRWLFGELTGPLLFAIAAFTVVSLSVGVMFDLVRRIVESGLPVTVAVQVMALKLPSFLVISFPMATLMATLLAYSRLSANSELTALRSVGVSTVRLVAPALVLAILLTGLTLVFNDVIVPQANRSAESTLQRALGRSLATEKGKDIIYSRFGRLQGRDDEQRGRGLNQLFYARRFEKGEMLDVTVLDFSRVGFRQMLVAEKALWREQEAKWEFLDGQILTLNTNGSTTRVDFDRYLYPLSAGPLKVARLPRDANNMTIGEAIKARQLYVEAGNAKEARRLAVRIQEKFTFPVSCLVFALIGSSLGSRPGSRTSRSQGFGISVLLILGYYVLSFSFSSLGVKGTLPAVTAAWLPVLISLGCGGALLRQASR
ncbi:MAG: LptF/LptG family permease [Synechococcus sp. BS301-5m-G54]|uniref:LptF/LptG family permease n=1 Tax=Synechococcales TaxID=1890424 RepID=UPI0004E0485B|nr:LptF/LptG family permease [Synechococcus sp. KORDI-49]MBL6739631.1 LptF/LptG family permease [Synechococcus sp. BS301-5m-G54]MBL6795938.1 LptF/LptG family permease [Synechococcus sp. BS307-5m-G34]RCL54838.1 MAG: YjgP/YjgQ family permease [Synechococcus sp. MED-G70]HCX54369.1 YjgP/YjgQ family permease [Synechococcus sp. UBA9887]AII45383.1 permease [Synechococcus sp. KORDI-49]